VSDRVDPPPPGPPPPDGPGGPPPPPEYVGEPLPPDEPARRAWRREWWILLALLLLAAAAVVAFFVFRDSGGGDTTTMPNVVGMQEQAAEARVREAGLEPNVEGETSDRPEGTVISQDPGAGTELDEGEEVVLGVSRGGGTTTVTETETVTTTGETETETQTETETETTQTQTQPQASAMPDLVGQPYQGAVQALVGVGLLVNSYPVESEEAQGTVVAQNPAASSSVGPQTVPRLNVAIGPSPRGTATVPDLTGPKIEDALGSCADANVTCLMEDTNAPDPDNVGEVVDQDPAAGTRVPKLDQVTLFVGR
jgi:eukaryotic-like serine/threonine-protein kinase